MNDQASIATTTDFLGEDRQVSTVALLGRDFGSARFEMLCNEGDRVEPATALMRDVRRTQIIFTSPVSGRVSRIERGARRKLVSLQIEVDNNDGVQVAASALNTDIPMRKRMLASGAWTALRTRPFGNIPDPDAEPTAVFVTAIDNEPGAPAAAAIIDQLATEFRAGVLALTEISDALLYLCHAKNRVLPIDESAQIRCVAFASDPGSGLPGLHINTLVPIGFAGAEVWHIGYQEVISLGHQILHGTAWNRRVISLGGDAVKKPRQIQVPPGASIADLFTNETQDGALQFFSGSELYGRPVGTEEAFLGAGHRQLCASFKSSHNPELTQPGRTAVLIPSERLDRLSPPGIYLAPLLRALQLGDVDRAQALGALELVEEDLARLSQASQPFCDYGLLLRKALDQLEQAR